MLSIDTSLLTGTLCTPTYQSSDGCTHITSVVESVSGSYISGAFRISFGNHLTTFLPHNASATAVRTALVTLDATAFKYVQVQRVDISTTMENQLNLKRARDTSGMFGKNGNDDNVRYQSGHRWCIEFVNVTGDIATINIDGSRLEGDGISVASEEQIAGHERLSGSFQLSFSGQTTSKISHDASSDEIVRSLQALTNIGSISVTRTKTYHSTKNSQLNNSTDNDMQHDMHRMHHGMQWNVTFTSLSQPSNIGPMPMMSIDSLKLIGTDLIATVSKINIGCCTFTLSSNGVDFTPLGLPYRFDPVSMVTSISPTTGPASGGTILTIRGVGFWNPGNGEVSCIFGEIPYHMEVMGTRIDDTKVLCVSPVQSRSARGLLKSFEQVPDDVFFGSPLNRGSLRVRINLGNRLLVNSTSQSRSYFTYNSRSTITSLVPKTGSLSGGTIIRIHGIDFPNQLGYSNNNVLCKFGDASALIVGVYISNTELECVSPSIMQQAPDTAPETADTNTNINGNTRNTRNTRDTMEAYVTLEVSFNGGIDFTQSDLQFWYRPTPEVRSVLPMRGPASGGTSIIVTGIHFERSLHLSCKFGNSIEDNSDSVTRSRNSLLAGPSIVSATWISPTKVSCITPPLEPKSEIQRITLKSSEIIRHVQQIKTISSGPGSTITTGTFKLKFGDYDLELGTYPDAETTTSLNYDATAADMKTKLELLPSIVQVDVTRSDVGNFGVYSWMVTFVSSAFAVPELVAEDFDASFISGAYVTSETVVEGSNYGVVLQQESVSFIGSLPLRSSIQEITLAASSITFATQLITIETVLNANNVITGTFSIKMAGSSTAATPTFVLTPTATATEVEEAVEHALSTSSFDQTIGANVQVTRTHALAKRGYVWTITYLGVPLPLASQPTFAFPGVAIETHSLSSGAPTFSSVTPPTQPLSGTYRLAFEYGIPLERLETININSHAPPSVVEEALNALLPSTEEHRILVTVDNTINSAEASTEKVLYRIVFPKSFGYVSLVSIDSTLLIGTNSVSSTSFVQHGIVTASSGFTLTVGIYGPTSMLPHDASAKTMEHAIETITQSIHMDVHVSRFSKQPSGYQWIVTFPETWTHSIKSLTAIQVPIVGAQGVADALLLTTTLDQIGTYQTLTGTFTLSFPSAANYASPSITPVDTVDHVTGMDVKGSIDGVAPIVVAWDASAVTVENALVNLPYVRQVKVTRSNAKVETYPEEGGVESTAAIAGFVWTVTFLSYGSYLHEGFVPLLEVSPSNTLVGNDLYLDVEVIQEGNGPSVPVEVTNNGQEYTTSHETFQYHSSIILGTIFPKNGPSIGGTKVIITLAEHSYLDFNRFQFAPEDADSLEFEGMKLDGLTCQFNSTIVPATVITKNSISCFTPPHVIGNTSVSVSLNGEDFSPSVLKYRYDVSARGLMISPLSGPITGGTVISISGFDFGGAIWNMDNIKCSFGQTIVSAFWSTRHKVKCRAPPVTAPRSVSVEISTNVGIDYTNQRVQYFYEEIRHVSNVYPRVGPSTGNTLITITGGPFPNYTSTLFCRFGNQPIQATFVSETTLQCISPHLRPIREIQSITYQPDSTDANSANVYPSGTFALIVGEHCTFIASGKICLPQSTSFMNWNISAVDLKQTIERLPEIGTVRVTRIPLTDRSVTWRITFMSDLQRGNVNEIQISDASIYPSEYEIIVSTLLQGSDSATGRVAVEVTSNAVDYTSDGVVFEYQAIVQVTRIYPTHGPLFGRTEVFVYGSNFRNTSGLYCHFGLNNRGSAVPATAYINSSCIKCVTPPVLYVRSVRVEVSNNGADPFTTNQSTAGPWYTFDRKIQILNIYPKSGPSTGNTSVRIVGENFLPTDEMKCKFGSFIVRAVWLNGHEMVCRSPPHTPGSFPLEITANDQDYTSQNLPYLFYKPVYMVNIHPVSGPAWAAGTPLHIYGNNFFNTSTLACRVADVSSPAEYISDTEVVCYTPPCLNSYTGGACKMVFQPLSAHMNLVKDPRTGSLKLFPTAHYYPLYSSKLVPVEMSNNGQDFTFSGIRFLYQQDAVITAIAPKPARGWDTGYTPLFITGIYFVNSTALRCRIGDRTLRATFVTSRLIYCSTPTHPTSEMEHGQQRHGTIAKSNFDHADKGRTRGPASARNAGNVFVEIANNGEDFTSSYTFFNYTGPCPNGYYCPIHDLTSKQQCPRGTYCRGEGNRNFTMCPLGKS